MATATRVKTLNGASERVVRTNLVTAEGAGRVRYQTAAPDQARQ